MFTLQSSEHVYLFNYPNRFFLVIQTFHPLIYISTSMSVPSHDLTLQLSIYLTFLCLIQCYQIWVLISKTLDFQTILEWQTILSCLWLSQFSCDCPTFNTLFLISGEIFSVSGKAGCLIIYVPSNNHAPSLYWLLISGELSKFYLINGIAITFLD